MPLIRFTLLFLICLLPAWAEADKLPLEYAIGFEVEQHDGFKTATVFKLGTQIPGWRYLFIPRGSQPPQGYEDHQLVEVPVKRVTSLSTTYLAYMDDANLLDTLVGVSRFKSINTPAVRKMIDAGKLVEAGQATDMRVELLLGLDQDVIFTTSTGTLHDTHPKLLEAGMTTALVLDYMEAHPLGRLEWVKFLALFFGTEQHAEQLFNDRAERYNALKALTQDVQQRPRVITGRPFQGQWRVPNGNSYVSIFLEDAGGDYLWDHLPGQGSKPMDIEAVYEQAMEAEFWLHAGSWKSLRDIAAADSRFIALPAWENGAVYNNNRRLNQWGGNDYWEAGIIHPEWVLADLISILQPQLLPDHQRYFYRHLQ